MDNQSCSCCAVSPVPHAFTVDVEDWSALMCMYQGRTVPVSTQFANATTCLLDLLEAHGLKATFFVVASQARQTPRVVQEIVARGHELGSHGWRHLKTRDFTAQNYREDIHRSVQTLQDLSGEPIYGHRCPFFSLLPGQVWALEAMAEEGLEYDSSTTELVWRRSGEPIPDAPFVWELPSGRSLVEFPALARKVGPVTARYLGGRGLRNLPRRFCLSHMTERCQEALPALLYLHTYEVMPDRLMQYVPPGGPLLERLKLTVAARSFEVGLGHLRRNLDHLLAAYDWAPAREVIRALHARGEVIRCSCRAG